jgi:Domain of unknown function (DUF4350)
VTVRTRRGTRRWPRLVIPYVTMLTIVIACAVAYEIQQPDPTDQTYLSPTSAAQTGASRLAARLTQRGVRINRVTSTPAALNAAIQAGSGQGGSDQGGSGQGGSGQGGVTIFVPTPVLVHPFYLRMIKLLPASTRVVLVAPDARVLDLGLIPAGAVEHRLATEVARPNCGYAPASGSATAGVHRLRYATHNPVASCYGGSLAVVRKGASEVTLVGSDEPFRNDRIGEHDNATLATALLSGASTVIWLDLHHAEQQPAYIDNPAAAGRPGAPPSLGSGPPDPDFPIPVQPTFTMPKGGQPPIVPDPANPLWRAFPPWVFAAVALLALATILAALARGRRLGPPVQEPLPITVRAAETVEGRGRLYRRAKARGPAAEALRDRGRDQVKRLLGLDQYADPATVVAGASATTGWPSEQVWSTLYGAEPADDRELVRTALDIEGLLQAVTRHAPSRPDAPEVVPEGELR